MSSSALLGANVRMEWSGNRVARAMEAAKRWPLPRAGAYIRGIAQRMIARKVGPSAPGKPPHTHTGALKQAIVFNVEGERVVIGPTATMVGTIGRTHEWGGVEAEVVSRRDRRYKGMRLYVGGIGPIGEVGGRVRYAKLRTQRQADRSLTLAKRLWPSKFQGRKDGGRMTKAKPARHYPPRPFMGPALNIALASKKLPPMWAGSVRN